MALETELPNFEVKEKPSLDEAEGRALLEDARRKLGIYTSKTSEKFEETELFNFEAKEKPSQAQLERRALLEDARRKSKISARGILLTNS